jgi:hypothetical protein
MIKQPSLTELVAKYVSAIADARDGKGYLPIWATDLSLYLGKFQLWFESPMQLWSNYIAEQTLRGRLSPFWKREVVRYVPLRDSKWTNLAAAKEYWMQIRLGMHWLLASGAVNVVTFGELDSTVVTTLNFALVPQLVLIESHGLFDDDFETSVQKGRHSKTTLLADLMDSLLPHHNLDKTDPEQQTVFPIYYREDSFRASRQPQVYFRHIMGRFNWRLQAGVCPDCGIDERHAFEEMHVDHVIPVRLGGNNTLLNTEMRCSRHNQEKNKRLSDTRDYMPVAEAIMHYSGNIDQRLSPLFSLEDKGIPFPVRFRFVPS